MTPGLNLGAPAAVRVVTAYARSEKGRGMRAGVLIGVGALAALTGVIWALQGFSIIGGSFMSGDSVWAIVGPVTAIVGLALAGFGIRLLRTR